ncbi:hypothetical protein BJV78DRAFT_1223055 [Lactifluus subvellereus]|nr:hypothetical protein BJV78DRAFT_1223055 [Lactifluus subvellereus]
MTRTTMVLCTWRISAIVRDLSDGVGCFKLAGLEVQLDSDKSLRYRPCTGTQVAELVTSRAPASH